MPSRAVLLLLCTLLVVSRSGLSQDLKLPDTPEVLDIAQPSDRFPAKWYPSVGDGTEVLPAPVTDHPYTAVPGTISRGSGNEQFSSEGGFQARDRVGRPRREGQSGAMSIDGTNVKIKTVIVSDPVSHCAFQWLQAMDKLKLPPGERVAVVTCEPQTIRYKDIDIMGLVLKSTAEGTTQDGDTTTKAEHLTPLRINGFTVDRLRVTNSRPDEKGNLVSWTTGTWYSPELRKIIRHGSDQEGYTELTKIRPIDPEPRLFYPPDDYRIEAQPAKR